jgi:long-chain acyl-CoA synthetase
MTAPTTIADISRSTSTEHPDSPAVVGEGRPVTHGELGRRSDAFASGLVSLGLEPGDRVAYLARNATEYWELFFAAAKAGVAVVPLNFRLSRDEAGYVLGDCEPAVLLAEEHLAPLVPSTYAGRRLVFSQTGETPAPPAGWTAYEEWLADQAAVDPRRDAGGDAL